MTTFEEIGRKLDRELQRLRDAAEDKVKPAARQKAARALRRVAESFGRLAEDLEKEPAPKK